MGAFYSFVEESEQTIITSNRQYSYNNIQPQSLIQLDDYFNDDFNDIITNINTITPDIETPESDDDNLLSPDDF